MTTPKGPVAKAEMLVRKPVGEVFEAFVDPAITSRFWFTSGSGRLDAGRPVTWEWKMYGVSAVVRVTALETDRRIRLEWPGAGGPTTVEWTFTPRADGATFVSIANWGFAGDAAAAAAEAVAATEGFALVLAALKAWLEHGVALTVVGDRFPDGLGGR